MYRCFVPVLEGLWAPAVHSNCRHNEMAALVLRTMGRTPDDPKPCTKGGNPWASVPVVHEYFKSLRVLVKRKNVDRMSFEAVIAGYSGALARRYKEALVKLKDEGLSKHDYLLSGFLKGEKFNPLAKVSKPRMINPRSPKYNLVLASYLKPLEHALWRHWKVGHNCEATRVSGKGLTSFERASLIEAKMASVGSDVVVMEVDGVAFEAHVTEAQLSFLEHSVYRAAYPGDHQLRRLLKAQLKLKGKTAGGVKYERPGCRASGDFNTGLGNTLLMGSFVICTMVTLNLVRPWTVLADGDNCLLFVTREDLRYVEREFQGAMSKLCAHEMTVEKPVAHLEGVTFGQSNPVRTARGPVMVRNPWKVLSGAFCGYRYFNEPRFSPSLLRGIALAERAVCTGVPLLGPYFERASHLLRHFRLPTDLDKFLEGHLLGVDLSTPTSPVTLEARVSFDLAFGVGIDEQLRIEADLIAQLDTYLLPVVKEARWLKNITHPSHGKGHEGANSGEQFTLDATGWPVLTTVQ